MRDRREERKGNDAIQNKVKPAIKQERILEAGDILAMTIFLSLLLFSVTQAQTQQETLRQYVSDLKKSPYNYGLREKIIELVQTLKSRPEIPEEARRHFIKGTALFKDARTS